MPTLLVTETELRSCLKIDESTLNATEQAFTWLAEGRVSMPPVMHIDVDSESAVDTKGAFVAGLDHLAVKIATGFFRNPTLGLPSSTSIMALVNAGTGQFDCVFLDNGFLMDLRTGLAGAVAAKHLAPKAVATVGVVGTGVQARYQIESLALVRTFERLLVYGRNAQRVNAYCTEMTKKLGIVVEPCVNLKELVGASQVVVTTTQATEPLIKRGWLHPGLHITAMGSDLPGKQELDATILECCEVLACDVEDQCRIGGELQHLGSNEKAILELGSLTSAPHAFERDPKDMTVCDLTGTGAQDTAIAVHAYAAIKAAGLGTSFG